MNKQELVQQYKADIISRQSLGMLRRMVIQEVFKNLTEQPTMEVIASILNKNRTKVDLHKLAEKVG
ncbi:MAG: hypothetical protein ACI8O8_002395, partial [Oleiphilaceae bacterium]